MTEKERSVKWKMCEWAKMVEENKMWRLPYRPSKNKFPSLAKSEKLYSTTTASIWFSAT
jgi:hypothetical protein